MNKLNEQELAQLIGGHVLDSWQRERVIRETLKAFSAIRESTGAYGANECPICLQTEPHSHSELEEKGYKLCGYHLAEYEKAQLLQNTQEIKKSQSIYLLLRKDFQSYSGLYYTQESADQAAQKLKDNNAWPTSECEIIEFVPKQKS